MLVLFFIISVYIFICSSLLFQCKSWLVFITCDIFLQTHLNYLFKCVCYPMRDSSMTKIWNHQKTCRHSGVMCAETCAQKYVKLWDWMQSNFYKSVMWNRFVYVWSCCAYAQVIHIEYGTMHCWQGCHIGDARWISPNAPALLSPAFIPVCVCMCVLVNILVMSRSLSGMQTSQNSCVWITSNCLDGLMCVCVSRWNVQAVQQKATVSQQVQTHARCLTCQESPN